MASSARLMAAGLSAGAANLLGIDSNPGALLIAAGTNFATALVLTAEFNLFGTVAAGTGAALPFAEFQPPVTVYNGGANALLIYPQATEGINAVAIGGSFSVAAGKSCIFTAGRNAVSTAVGWWIATLSA